MPTIRMAEGHRRVVLDLELPLSYPVCFKDPWIAKNGAPRNGCRSVLTGAFTSVLWISSGQGYPDS